MTGVSDLLDMAGGAVREVGRASRVIPGVKTLEAGASRFERVVLRELKRRMDEAVGLPAPGSTNSGSRTAQVPAFPTPEQALANPGAALRSIGDTMQALLRRSMNDTPDVSRR